MTCTPIKIGSMRAIVCTRGRGKKVKHCCACGRQSFLLCDWKVGSGTCSAPLCDICTYSPSRGRDLCPEHKKAWDAHPRNPLNKPKDASV